MKRALISFCAIAAVSTYSRTADAQIICLNCATEFTTILAWAQQLINDVKDLGLSDLRNGTLDTTLSSLTGVRDPGSALAAMRSLGIQDPMPQQAQQILTAISGAGSYSGTSDTLGQIVAKAQGLQAARNLASQLYNSQAQGLQQLNGARDRLATAGDPADKADAQNHIQLATSDGVRQNTEGVTLTAFSSMQQGIRDHNSEMLTRRDVCNYVNYLRANEGNRAPQNVDCNQYPLIDTDPAATASMTSGSYVGTGGGSGTQQILYQPGVGGSSDPMQQMLAQPWGQQAADNATTLGVNPTALAATCAIESNCNPNAVSPTGPKGAWQMASATYQSDINQVSQTAQNNPGLASQLSGGPTNPTTQSLAASQELANNAQQLQAAGVNSPTVLDARGAYQFGAGYGVPLAKADPATPMSAIVPVSALGPNGAAGMTVGQWRQSVANKIGHAANAPILLPSNT